MKLGAKGDREAGAQPPGVRRRAPRAAVVIAAKAAKFLERDRHLAVPRVLVQLKTEEGKVVTLHPLNAGFFQLERMRAARRPRSHGRTVKLRSK